MAKQPTCVVEAVPAKSSGTGRDEMYVVLRSAIYVRVSTDKQTIENHLLELRRIAKRRGWEVVH